ncbi:MFS transporter [Armillaria solidipes]|uniref:MFS transporter n=1 Tax=Armillaria solidipes TaxID=1076256 RepID=A0A2H3AN07_9AGAR|nr:MFS transporter [Armillaria solidipes]
MSAYSHDIDSDSSKSRHTVNPSFLATVSDDKQGGEAAIVIKNDDHIDPATERRYLYHCLSDDYEMSPCCTRLLRRLDLRIIPSMTLLCMLNFLARTNIGNARILNANTGDSILQVLHMTDHQFLITLMVFLIPYALLDTLSSYMLKYFSPPCWLAFLALGWGATDMGIAASQNYGTLISLRMVLGAFEAGLYPGIIYFLTLTHRPDYYDISSSGLWGALSGFVAYGAGHLNGAQGLEGWRWLFIIEGPPSCFLALGLFFFLPSYPEKASWLSSEDRDLSIRRLKDETSKSMGHVKVTWDGAKTTLRDGRLYLHYLASIAVQTTFSSLSLFSPTIVSGMGYEGLDAQLFTIPPLVMAVMASFLVSWVVDRYRTTSMPVFISMFSGGVTFLIQGALPPTSFKTRYVMLCIGTMSSYASIPLLVIWLTENLRDTDAMTLAIPMYITIGVLLGQITGIFIYKSSEAPGYPTGHYTNGSVLLVGALCVGILRVIYTRRNNALDVGQSRWIV